MWQMKLSAAGLMCCGALCCIFVATSHRPEEAESRQKIPPVPLTGSSWWSSGGWVRARASAGHGRQAGSNRRRTQVGLTCAAVCWGQGEEVKKWGGERETDRKRRSAGSQWVKADGGFCSAAAPDSSGWQVRFFSHASKEHLQRLWLRLKQTVGSPMRKVLHWSILIKADCSRRPRYHRGGGGGGGGCSMLTMSTMV